MTIRNFLCLALCIVYFQGNAQSGDKTADHDINIYKNAMQYSDYEAAKNAVFSLLEKHPENNAWLDSLTRLYFYIGANKQTIMAGNNCLKKDTSDKDILEIVAIANGNLRRYAEALDLYKRLLLRGK